MYWQVNENSGATGSGPAIDIAPPIAHHEAPFQVYFALVFCCTLLAALAQILAKRGSLALGAHADLKQVLGNPALFVRFAISIVTNPQLFLDYALSGINVVLLTLAVKGQELSRVYPIIALTFGWVMALSKR